ncbi:ankyrin repeat-containing domain protein, partial [Apodospora peruviana]
TPLHSAALTGNSAVVQPLLTHASSRSDTNVQELKLMTPLFHAAGLGHLDAFKVLLEENRCDINLPDKRQRTPLIEAASRGRNEAVEILLSQPGVRPNERDCQGLHVSFWAGWDLLICAAGRGHHRLAETLLQRPDVNINQQDNYESTPLARAAFRGRNATVELLLSHQDILTDRPTN